MTNTTIKSPLWIKITGYGFAAVLFASAAIGGLAWYRQADMSDKALYSKAASDLEVIQTDMAAIQRSASALALTLSGEPDLAGYIANNDRQALLNKFSKNMAAMKEAGGLQIITIGNAKGDIIARMHSPEKFGDNVIGRRKTIQAAVSTGKLAAGIEPGKNGIGIYAVAPVIVDGTVVGVVDIGTELSNAYFTPLADRLGAEISVNVIQEGKLTNQSSTEGGNRFLPAETIQAAFDGKEVFEPATLGGRDMLVKARSVQVILR